MLYLYIVYFILFQIDAKDNVEPRLSYTDSSTRCASWETIITTQLIHEDAWSKHIKTAMAVSKTLNNFSTRKQIDEQLCRYNINNVIIRTRLLNLLYDTVHM